MGLAQLDILEEEGVDLSRVVIGHQDLRSDLDTHEAIMKRGAYVQYDTIGKERYDYVIQENRGLWEAGPALRVEYLAERHYRQDDDRLACLVELINRGYADHIMLSQDMSAREACLNPNTHGEWGYAYLLGNFVPRLREAGVSEDALHLMLVENPRRFLRFTL
jgi:phosphotriesterase-related protein